MLKEPLITFFRRLESVNKLEFSEKAETVAENVLSRWNRYQKIRANERLSNEAIKRSVAKIKKALACLTSLSEPTMEARALAEELNRLNIGFNNPKLVDQKSYINVTPNENTCETFTFGLDKLNEEHEKIRELELLWISLFKTSPPNTDTDAFYEMAGILTGKDATALRRMRARLPGHSKGAEKIKID
jgi:hypothetical protein